MYNGLLPLSLHWLVLLHCIFSWKREKNTGTKNNFNRKMIKNDILGTIGHTPLVRINNLCPNKNVHIFAKLEGFNPTGSIKDRIAVQMIEEAEREGRLTPGKTIIEATSGNTGIGLAIAGIVKGYKVEIVMSEAVSIERRKIIQSYGGKVILTPADEGTDGAIRYARKLVAENPDKYFMPNQFTNHSNYLTHYETTAAEIWEDAEGQIDYLVCAIGTSGNTGIGLAIVGIIKGYKVEIVMSEAVSIERRKIIRSYGGKVILTPADEGTDGAIRYARKLVAENPDKYFMPNQFTNHSNYLTHYETTAAEIWEDAEGKIDYLVCAIGTSGTIMGVSKFLKQRKPDIKVVCAQPIKGHYIQGLKNMEEAIVPAIYDPSRIDIQVMIESEEAIAMAREIIAKEGIFAGMSSGAAMLAALKTAETIESGNIVVVFPDRAEKYLSTKMFDSFGD
jgi:cysteine synthase B